jgi:hypothetical protein
MFETSSTIIVNTYQSKKQLAGNNEVLNKLEDSETRARLMLLSAVRTVLALRFHLLQQ